MAYAYFMYEQQKILNEVSEKRLEAIKDFTELGSGFKIAMRDLSIRGPETFLVPNNMASLIRLGLICTHRCYLRQLLVNKGKISKTKNVC